MREEDFNSWLVGAGMGTCAWLATIADIYMLEKKGVPIWHCDEGLDKIPARTGTDVANDLAGRLLMRYVIPSLQHEPAGHDGVTRKVFVTPTPYSSDDLSEWCQLPVAEMLRPYVILIDPAKLTREIRGPQYIARARGIQYILPYGYTADAVVGPYGLVVC